MSAVRLVEVIRDLRGRLAPADADAVTDAALLDRFLARRDEDAFAALVRRHGPMVFGVCRRVLRDPHDAEDAFQATFLVLVRKGPAVRSLRSVGNWLYGVARRTALEARRAAARRRAKEAGAMARSATEGDARDEVCAVLDEELARLPEKLRAPVVLCELEGKTRKEAARSLGWPEGTVASRLASARRVLAARLTRRGIAVPVGAVAASAAGEASSAGVPAGLVRLTVRVAVGRAVASSGVAALVKGVVMTMLVKKLKACVGGLLVAVALGAGGVAFTGAGAPSARAADGQKPRSEVETLRHEIELLRTNLNVLLEKVHAQETELQALKGQARVAAPGRDGVNAVTFSPDRTFLFEVKPDGAAVHGGAVPPRPGTIIKKSPTDAEATFGYKLTGPASVFVTSHPIQMAEEQLKVLREAPDEKAREEAVKKLQHVLEMMKAHPRILGDVHKAP
jgi:RNA polymerase sigma factor (sigma-70 family)